MSEIEVIRRDGKTKEYIEAFWINTGNRPLDIGDELEIININEKYEKPTKRHKLDSLSDKQKDWVVKELLNMDPMDEMPWGIDIVEGIHKKLQ